LGRSADAWIALVDEAALRGADSVVLVPIGDPDGGLDDLRETLRQLARLRPFLDLHLAAPITWAEYAADLATRGLGRCSLAGRDPGCAAGLGDALWRLGVAIDEAAAPASPPGSAMLDGRVAAALADRSLMPAPWQEVLQAIASGEAHHGGGPGERVAVALGQAAPPVATGLASAPSAISPQAPCLVEPVPADAVPETAHAAFLEVAYGIRVLTGLIAIPGEPGWIGVRVPDPLFVLRALVAQGVLARRHDRTVWMPCGPQFRPRHEIRSLLTAFAAAISAR
jgi:hypothetical protein